MGRQVRPVGKAKYLGLSFVVRVWPWVQKSKIDTIAGPAITGAVGFFLLILQIAPSNQDWWWGRRILSLIDNRPWLLTTCFILLIGVAVARCVHRWLDGLVQPHMDLTAEGLGDLLNAIDHVVDVKNERFHRQAVKERLSRVVSPAEVFLSITRPEEQLKEIVRTIQSLVALLHQSRGLQVMVVLAEMGKKHPIRWLAWAPDGHPPGHDVEKFQTPNCCFSRAKAEQRLIIVSDINRAANHKQFHSFGKQPGEGSLMCMPVRHIGDYPLVLSVYVPVKGLFMDFDRKKWENVFRRFESRISIEYSLLILRRLTEQSIQENANVKT